MSYAAIVSKITVRPHPNADRLQLGLCLGNQVIVGLDVKDGDLGVYFPPDGQLSHQFCVRNKLYNVSALTALDLWAPHAGYFDVNRKVRAQRFRGEKSDGFWAPIDYFLWTGNHNHIRRTLTEGYSFTTLCGEEICQKYYNPKTLRAMKNQPAQTRKHSKYFPKHQDTTQFRFVADTVPEDGVYYITEKLHGTSGRYGHVPVSEEIVGVEGWLRRTLRLKPRFTPPVWKYLNGSRQVTLETTSGPGFYGTNEFRYQATRSIELYRGEIIFFELVGWVSETTPIMPPHDTTKLQDKALLDRYGKQMNYHYACEPGTCKLYVYKIAHVNDQGIPTELSWAQVVLRCRELNLPVVPLISGPLTAEALKRKWSTENFHEALRWEVENHTLGASTLDDRQIREGVVLRIESPTLGTTHIKNKAWEFGVMEGFWKEKDAGVDLEEIS